MKDAIWTLDSDIPPFPPLEGDLKTDVLIIGGGLAGILCAWMLGQDGVDYALIEADRIVNGVSRNTTAKITSQHGLVYDKLIREFCPEKARLYWEANEAALREYRAMARSIDCDFETKDNYVYATESVEKLERELTALERIDVHAKFVNTLPLPFPVAGAVCFPDQAQFNPRKFASEAAKGLRIYERTAAKSFLGNTVLTDRGKITASKIIIATHFPMLNKHGSYFLKMYQQRSYVLALDDAAQVDGMYLDAAKNGLSFRNYGSLLLIGGGGHRTGKQGGGWKELETFGKRYYPKANEVCRWATQDCMTLDAVPYIGQYSRRTQDLYVAAGFNKWGMTGAMTAALVLRDLVQGRDNPYAQLFSPSRTMLRQQLFVNAVETAAHLLTPSKPRCPHMGCALKWNRQEHSWDCPCHGSRFTDTGVLLDNPATGDLEL